MEVLFLGTCAYDYAPKLNEEFINAFDVDARRSSCLLMEGKYLIDCGDHALDSLRIAGIELSAISDVFISHLHRDHYNSDHIQAIAKAKKDKLRVWVREGANIPDMENVEVISMICGEKYTIDEGVFVVGTEANHDKKSCPQHFLFDVGGKSFLYACDGAWFCVDTYYRLRNAKLDLFVVDATCGDYLGDYRIGEHNCIPMLRIMMPSLKTFGAITDDTQIYLSHIAPSLHKPHKEIEQSVQSDGWKVAYDGLKVVVK